MTGGAAIAASSGELALLPGLALPLVCITAAAAGVIRRYVVHQEQRIRELFNALAREHAERERALDRRENDLVHREAALRRTRFVTEMRIANVHGRLDQVLTERTDERLRHAELQVEYAELAREYNDLCREADAKQARVDRPPVAVGQTESAADSRGPRRTVQRRGPRPFLTVVESPRGNQDSA
ncbi:hypothetical protein PV387_23190 [Streptomyces sp. ME02-6987-2C]|uniref:hypothetical protein n=1 Tax=unclassified Streptomyces TaxID=2593676 RepID=UPI0029BE19F1|nr:MULTISPECIES: hypothetical protein [unclassified Streptomyces]MDX3345996.1 hypothetical protein [Streptomyces sp. ME02-6979A]MDX3368908.1 hypothetical protein [Streptomyces sp. ME02-6987-2C]MDX3407805.1 hypothetical protein [Streptomyces sp. ME02-6977A]MDX3421762.1 hypothetical protein [Streptomyces sp. ME02-6985-2c]